MKYQARVNSSCLYSSRAIIYIIKSVHQNVTDDVFFFYKWEYNYAYNFLKMSKTLIMNCSFQCYYSRSETIWQSLAILL